MLRETDPLAETNAAGAPAPAVAPVYLVGFGISGWFDRFIAPPGLELCRADRVVVRTHRGVEFGTVLCFATSGHERFLQDRAPGEILRRLNEWDCERSAGLEAETRRVFDSAGGLARELAPALEIVDVEALVEPRTFVVHHLGTQPDVRPLVSRLSKQFDAYVELMNLSTELAAEEGDACEVCGSTEGGGCGSEGGGGCGTDGQCGTAKKQMSPAEWQAYFAELRKKMNPVAP